MSTYPLSPNNAFYQEFTQLKQRFSELEQRLLAGAAETGGDDSVLAAIGRIRQVLEREAMLQTTATELKQLFQADRVILVGCNHPRTIAQGEVIAEAVQSGLSPMLSLSLQREQMGDRPEALSQGEVIAVDDVMAVDNGMAVDNVMKEQRAVLPLRILVQYQVKSSLSVALMQNGELWGIVDIHHCATQHSWTSWEIKVIGQMAEQISTALEQAAQLAEAEYRSEVLQTSLVSELRKRADELAVKADQETIITRVIRKIRQTLDAETIFSTASGETRNVLQCDRVTIYRFNPDWSGEFVWDSVAQGWQSLAVGKGVKTTWADTYLQETQGGRYRQQESFAVDDVYRVGHTPCHLEILEQFHIRAYCIVPIFVGTRLWGLMAAYQHSGPRSWAVEEVNVLSRIGSQVGVALQHTQAMEQLQSQSEQLQQAVERERAVAKIIDKIRRSLDIDTIFQTTAQETRQLVQADRVAIYRFNPDWSGRFVVESVAQGWKSLLEAQREDSALCRNVSECTVKALATADFTDTYLQENQGGFEPQTRPFRVTSDIYQEHFSDCYIQLIESFQARAYAIVAIYKGQKLWGLLAAYQNASARHWSQSDVQFLLEVSNHLGVALQQAELLGQAEKRSTLLQSTLESQLRQRAEELEREAKREKTVSKVIEKIRDSLDITTIFNTTATEVRQLLNADRVAMLRFIPGTEWHQGEFVAEDVLPQYMSSIQCQVEDHCFAEHRAQDYRKGCIWSMDDIYDNPLKDCYLEILERFQVRANLVVPLIKGDDLWGLLCIHQCSAPRHWLDQDKEFVVQIATQLGVALQQAEFLNQLQKAKEAADTANLAKSKFLANMSHELRTPLNAILGFAQVMARDASLNPEQKETLEIIGRSGEHLLALINDVLEMSKIEAGQITLNEDNFDLYHLLDSLEKMLELKAESKGVQFIVDCADDVPQYIHADKSKLRQVLINLLSNAIKFTQEGYVRLRVCVKPESLKAGDVKAGDVKRWELEFTERRIHSDGNGPEKSSPERSSPNGRNLEGGNGRSPAPAPTPATILHFEVNDTGSGIAADELEHLFEPFTQTESGRKSQEGTGLGLPISQTFVRLMGGLIAVQTQVGAGSTFQFDLPVQIVDAVHVPAPDPNRQIIGLQPGQPTYRILVAEDKWENRQLLVRLLTTIGFDVKEAMNGQEAVECCQHWHPHLIWMDMRMPVMDGYEATRQIKTHHADHAPIILALTANAFEEERLVALSLGCDDFIRKPFQATVILEKMAQFLDVRYIYTTGIDDDVALPDRGNSATLPFPENHPNSEMSSSTTTGKTSISERVTTMMTSSLKILAAEDNLINRKLIGKMLEQLGHTVTTVSNGLEVLEALQNQTYDVVLMDIQMPEMDGMTATRQIRQQGTSAYAPYIVAMTGHVSEEDKNACLEAGMNAFLTKPIRLNTLATVLGQCQHQCASQAAPLVPEPLNAEMLEQIPPGTGDEAGSFLRVLIETYFEDAPNYLSRLDRAIAQQDIDTFRATAHSLKSMSASLGSTDFAQLCQTFEDMKAIADFPSPSQVSAQLHQAYERFKLALQQVYEQSKHSRAIG